MVNIIKHYKKYGYKQKEYIRAYKLNNDETKNPNFGFLKKSKVGNVLTAKVAD